MMTGSSGDIQPGFLQTPVLLRLSLVSLIHAQIQMQDDGLRVFEKGSVCTGCTAVEQLFRQTARHTTAT